MSFKKGHIAYTGIEKTQFKKGQKPWNTGRSFSVETKEKMSKAKLRFELSNGRTLCVECHKKTPNYGYKAVLVEGGGAHELQSI